MKHVSPILQKIVKKQGEHFIRPAKKHISADIFIVEALVCFASKLSEALVRALQVVILARVLLLAGAIVLAFTVRKLALARDDCRSFDSRFRAVLV